MYESPLSMITNRMAKEISQSFDEMVFQEVMNVGVHVDRDELIKALAYDRDQYNKGYEDGVADGKSKWISVEDKLPDGEVLAANFAAGTYGYKEYIIGYVSAVKCTEQDWHKGKCCAENDHEILNDVTHWMPLPEPQKEG